MKKGQILKSLKIANLSGTSIDSKALEFILTYCKSLHKLVIDDEIWTSFFSQFQVQEDKIIPNGCLDCVGPVPNMLEINMISNVAHNLSSILFLFPKLSHLTLNKPMMNTNPELIANLSMHLSDFENQNSLSLKDVHFDHISPFLASMGPRLTHLCFAGKSTVINLHHLNSTCPNLKNLDISYSTLTGNEMSDAKIFAKLQNLKLWDIHVQGCLNSPNSLKKCIFEISEEITLKCKQNKRI